MHLEDFHKQERISWKSAAYFDRALQHSKQSFLVDQRPMYKLELINRDRLGGGRLGERKL